jgi:RecA-family ATPase
MANLKVLLINAEDGRAELLRRSWAFCLAHARKLAGQSLDRLYVAGADDARVQRLSFLRTAERNISILDHVGFAVLEDALKDVQPDVLILDPLVAFCGGGNMNDNAIMSLVRPFQSSFGECQLSAFSDRTDLASQRQFAVGWQLQV